MSAHNADQSSFRVGGLSNRRNLLFGSAASLAGLALWVLLGQRRQSPPNDRSATTTNHAGPGAAYHGALVKARAKRVIFCYMSGGPSQMDTFDPKPRLAADDGKEYQPPNGESSSGKLMGSPFRFARYGNSGADVSELFPHIAMCVDEIAFIRSMVTNSSVHPSANYFLHSGSLRPGYPSIGSWITYGLGSDNNDLPSYIVLNSGQVPEGGMVTVGNGFLPATRQPTVFGLQSSPIENLQPLEPASSTQRTKLDLIQTLNRQAMDRFGQNSELEALIANYELAFRMQTVLPEVLDFSGETKSTLELYGITEEATHAYGTQCLRARKLIENGVRFVELFPNSLPSVRMWDQHTNLEKDLRANALAVDKPTAALLKDLRARGLLDDTLVLWGGEFGRKPVSELSGSAPGRDHSEHGYTMWMAGGGVRPGIVYGATDDYGDYAVETPVHVHDLQATILHLLGMDHTQLTYRYSGRDFRLTDVYGDVVHDLLA